MQQYLPFTVLKLYEQQNGLMSFRTVATVLTVYGIETGGTVERIDGGLALQQYLPFTGLKHAIAFKIRNSILTVATVLTVYGIETQRL